MRYIPFLSSLQIIHIDKVEIKSNTHACALEMLAYSYINYIT